jgi:hypothetical protein
MVKVEGELLSAEYKPDDVKEPLQLCEITPGRQAPPRHQLFQHLFLFI